MSASRRLLGAGWVDASAYLAVREAHVETPIRLSVFTHPPIWKCSSGWLGETSKIADRLRYQSSATESADFPVAEKKITEVVRAVKEEERKQKQRVIASK